MLATTAAMPFGGGYSASRYVCLVLLIFQKHKTTEQLIEVQIKPVLLSDNVVLAYQYISLFFSIIPTLSLC